jgi:hypothetical protein
VEIAGASVVAGSFWHGGSLDGRRDVKTVIHELRKSLTPRT